MPFDGTNWVKPTDRVDDCSAVLQGALDILSVPGSWTAGQMHDSKGRYCLVGALFKATGGRPHRTVGRCLSVLGFRSLWQAQMWNDQLIVFGRRRVCARLRRGIRDLEEEGHHAV